MTYRAVADTWSTHLALGWRLVSAADNFCEDESMSSGGLEELLLARSPSDVARDTFGLWLFNIEGRDASAFMMVCRGIESLDKALRLCPTSEAVDRRARNGDDEGCAPAVSSTGTIFDVTVVVRDAAGRSPT